MIATRREWLRQIAWAGGATAAARAWAQPQRPEQETGSFAGRVWPSEPPPDCPFAASTSLTGFRFLGRWARYSKADTWYPSWASDGNLYSPWTDGRVHGLQCTSFGKEPSTGSAAILGDDPLNLTIEGQAVYPGNPSPYGGRYPCGSLVHNGVWYYGTYCLMDTEGDPGRGLNWDILGPFVGFRHSRDFGKTWTDTPHSPAKPLFSEPETPGGPVRIGVPHFVDFGRNMRPSPDGKAYLVAHGAAVPDPKPRPANASWITGDQINLIRVEPSLKSIHNPSAYEFFAGHDSRGRAQWTKDLRKMQPLVDWNNNCGNVTMTYNAPLKKFLLAITDGADTISRFNTFVLESDRITGPWRLVSYMRHFGEQAYFVNIPSKFIAPDGRTLWLCYAANFTNSGPAKTKYRSEPPGSSYGMVLQEVRLLAG